MFLLKSEKRFLSLIFFISLVTKTIFFFVFLKNNPCILMFDSEHYHKVALNILSWSNSYQFYRLPGYPFFLASCYTFFGMSTQAVITIQILLSSLIPILIFMLTLVLFPKQIYLAKIASVASCFGLGYIIFPGLVMSEMLFVIFFSIFLILFLYNYSPFFCIPRSDIPDKHPIIRFFLSGLALGVSCLIRPVGSALLLISVFMISISKINFKTKIKSATAVVSGFFLTLGPWVMRNYILTGYIFMHTLSGPHFLNHVAVRLCMIKEKTSYTQAQHKVYSELKSIEKTKISLLGRPLQEIESCKIKENLATTYILKDPLITCKFFIFNMLKTVFGLYSSELLVIDSGGQLPPYSNDRGLKTILQRFLLPQVKNKFIIPVIYFEIVFLILLLIGILLFTIRSFSRPENLCALAKTLPFIGCFIFITLACGFARLRLPIESFLIILASKGWGSIFKKG